MNCSVLCHKQEYIIWNMQWKKLKSYKQAFVILLHEYQLMGWVIVLGKINCVTLMAQTGINWIQTNKICFTQSLLKDCKQYLTISFPWVSTAFSSSCSLKLRRLTLSGSTLSHSVNPPFTFPAWMAIRRLYSGAAFCCDLGSPSSRSSSSIFSSSSKLLC